LECAGRAGAATALSAGEMWAEWLLAFIPTQTSIKYIANKLITDEYVHRDVLLEINVGDVSDLKLPVSLLQIH